MHCTPRLEGHNHRDISDPPTPPPTANGGKGGQLKPLTSSPRGYKANHMPLNVSGGVGPTEAFSGSAVQLAAEMAGKMIAIYR